MEWIEKIRFWLYDILGLFIPGVLILLLINIHLKEEITPKLFCIDSLKYSEIYLVLILIAFIYILGNILKIVSQLFYDFLEVLFDSIILKVFKLEINSKDNPVSNFIKKYTKYIFSFKTEKYLESNEYMIEKVQDKIYKNSDEEKAKSIKEKWRTIYKVGKVIEENKGIKTLSGTFLAKYTLYRSLSFIFFINFILLIFETQYLIEIKRVFPQRIFQITMFLSWVTFHIKFKKYYALCGNETLVGLYYKFILEE